MLIMTNVSRPLILIDMREKNLRKFHRKEIKQETHPDGQNFLGPLYVTGSR